MAYRKTSYQAFVSGRKGQGKTVLTDSLARAHSRVFVFDVLHEYPSKGFTCVRSMEELKAAVKTRWRKGWRIAYLPHRSNRPKQLHDLALTICDIQMPYKETPDDGTTPPIPKVLFIIEEMRWSYPNGCNYEGLAELTTLGRHYGVDMIGTTQRIAEVNTNFRGTSDVRFFFAQEEDRDIQAIAPMIGRHNVARLKALQVHECLRLYGGQVTLYRNNLGSSRRRRR